jgi:hypothetical protein
MTERTGTLALYLLLDTGSSWNGEGMQLVSLHAAQPYVQLGKKRKTGQSAFLTMAGRPH